MKQEKSDELTFTFIFPDEYNPVYANGVHGEVTPRGEFLLHFVQERRPLPNSVTHEITENGKLGKEVKRKPDGHANLIVKYVTTGVTLNYGDAKSIHSWLGNMIRNFEMSVGIRGNEESFEHSDREGDSDDVAR